MNARKNATLQAVPPQHTAIPPQAPAEFDAELASNFPQVSVPLFNSVAELAAEYERRDAAIREDFAGITEVSRTLLADLSYMQSLLSKQGDNHRLVIEARAQGHKIPSWTEFYREFCGESGLGDKLRTIQQRLKDYRDSDGGTTCKKADCKEKPANRCGGYCKEHKPSPRLPAYAALLNRLLKVIESHHGTLPQDVTECARSIRAEITFKQAEKALDTAAKKNGGGKTPAEKPSLKKRTAKGSLLPQLNGKIADAVRGIKVAVEPPVAARAAANGAHV